MSGLVLKLRAASRHARLIPFWDSGGSDLIPAYIYYAYFEVNWYRQTMTKRWLIIRVPKTLRVTDSWFGRSTTYQIGMRVIRKPRNRHCLVETLKI